MPFGSLSPEQRVRILLELQNAAQYIRGMTESAAATVRLAESEKVAKKESQGLTASLFLQRQEMYTLRRYTFYATSALLASAVALGALGLKYYNTSQTALVGFTKMLGRVKAAKREISDLYFIAASTPFTFPAIVKAARYLQPFTKDVRLTNQVISDLTNSLSAMGNISDASLSRGSLALAHMFNLGRLTGQIMYQMARDNIPIQQALQAEYHTTGLVIKRDVAGGLITAQMAAKALHDYIRKTPGLSGAAVAQATKTLSGAASTLKDLLGMSVGGSEAGIFNSFRNVIRDVDKALLPMVSQRKPITLTNLANAFDKVLSPKTHLVIDLFLLFRTAIRTVEIELGLMVKSIQFFFSPLLRLSSLFGGNRIAAKLLGIVLGTLITLWTIGKIKAIAFATAETIANASSLKWTKGLALLNKAMKFSIFLMSGEALASLRKWAFATEDVFIASKGMYTQALKNNGIFAKMARAIFGVSAAEDTLTASVTANTVAWYANPVTWLVVAVVALTAGLVILYFKWKAFRNLVNETFNFFTHNKYGVAAAMGTAFGPLIAAAAALRYIINNMHRIKQTVHKTLLMDPTGDLGFGPGSTKTTHRSGWSNFWHALITPPPGMATGGTVLSSGLVRVGERGPEILHLPQGASVQPLNNNHLEGRFHITVTPQDIYMDGTKVGSVVSTAVLDKMARQ